VRETQWILDTPGGQYSLALRPASRSPLRTALDPSARRALEAWLMAARGAGRARWLMDEVGRSLARPLARETPEAEALVRAAFAEGQLRLERLPDRVPHGREERIESYAHDGVEGRSTRDELTWIAIRLEYDDDSGQGVAYARYVLKLPDGGVREGTLDRDGNARVDGLHPGMCEVTFPDFDRRKGAPPAKVPPGKGHQPRRPAPAPLPRERQARNEGAASSKRVLCAASTIEFLDPEGHGKRWDRQPGEERILQVVPVPSTQSTRGLDNVFPNWLAELIKKSSEDDAEHENDVEREGSVTVESKWGGERKLHARPVAAPNCGHRHPVMVRGNRSATLHADADHAMVTFGGRQISRGPVQPDVYTLETRGCEGDDVRVRVEVFPSDQGTAAVSVETAFDWGSVITEALHPLREIGIDIDVKPKWAGKLSYFRGWKEDDESWRAYSAGEATLKGTMGLDLNVQLSAAGMFLHVPEWFREYVSDVGVLFNFKLETGLGGSFERRVYPSSEEESRSVCKGTLDGSGVVEVGPYAKLGSEKILGASASGTLSGGYTLEGTITLDRGAIVAKASATRGEVKGTLKVLTRALFWKSEDSVDWVLIEKGEPHEFKSNELINFNHLFPGAA